MKTSYVFRDQVGIIGSWFALWNECEQVVALYALIRKIKKSQTKFLSQVLSQILLNTADSEDDQEMQANDPAFISGLCKESKDHAVSQLLLSLPLLRPGNDKAKLEYLRIIPKVMSHSVENGCHMEESRQLLSYLLIHPALRREEFADFTFWLNGLEENVKDNVSNLPVPVHRTISNPSNFLGNDSSGNPPLVQLANGCEQLLYGRGLNTSHSMGLINISNDGTISSNGRDSGICETEQTFSGRETLTSSISMPLTGVGSSTYFYQPWNGASVQPPGNRVDSNALLFSPGQGHQKLSRTSSVLTPGSMVPDWLSRHHEATAPTSRSHLSVHQDNLHPPVSPQSSITSSGSGGSDSHPDKTSVDDSSGMHEVSSWLKSLRLHKYSSLFQQITYDEMMNLTEDWLDEQGVTKGARNKILISIKKLQERQETLRLIERDIMSTGNIQQAINDVHQMLKTPIKSCNPSESLVKDVNPGVCSEGSGFSSSDVDCIQEGDLPGQITRVLGKICTQLLVVKHPDTECLNSYLQLLDRCSNHQAFTSELKKKLLPWRHQVHKFWQILMQKQAMERHRTGFINPSQPSGSILRGGQHRLLRGQRSQPSWTFGSIGRPPMQPTAISSVTGLHPGQLPYPTSSSIPPGFHTRQTTLDVPMTAVKQPVNRTQSAPIRSGLLGLSVPPQSAPIGSNDTPTEDPHINLDPSMQQHALGEMFFRIDD